MLYKSENIGTKGVTLVALILTIIIILILAGITIGELNENGLFGNAKLAKEKYENAQEYETQLIDEYMNSLTKHTGKNSINGNINNEGNNDDNNDYIEFKNKLSNGEWNDTKKINTPIIEDTGLIPVYWTGTEWVDLTEESTKVEWNNWYNYTETDKKWANARSKDGSMWVWIPRYEYKIDITNKSIDVRFISTDIKKGSSGYTTDTTGITISSDNYIIHPAFTDGTSNTFENGEWDKEIPGFWIAKYDAGYQNGTIGETQGVVQYSNLKYTDLNHNTTNFLTDSLTTNTNISYPVFKANTYAYNIISVGDAYLLAQELDGSDANGDIASVAKSFYGLSNTDSHLTKNSEWGAVAYLTHSKYGVNGNTSNNNEVTINNKNLNNSVRVNNADSGKSGNVYSVTSYGDSDVANDVKASSTKNMTGVFDLSGGVGNLTAVFRKGGSVSLPRWHNAMATSSTTLSTRYVTLYVGSTKKGDATNETSGWNSDKAGFPSTNYPTMKRGGIWDDGIEAGIFYTNGYMGCGSIATGFRVVLITQ